MSRILLIAVLAVVRLSQPSSGLVSRCELQDVPAFSVPITMAAVHQGVPSVSSLSMVVLQEIEYFDGGFAAFGDTDHDGLREVVFRRRDPITFVLSHRFYEVDQANNYSLVYDGPELVPYAIGDLDNDGKSELVSQIGSQIVVREAQTAATHPDTIIWWSPPMSNVVGYSAIGDTDNDGQMEIIHSVNSLGSTASLVIFESVGDNIFAQRLNVATRGNVAEKQVTDLDGDGLREIVFITTLGWVTVLESDGDDSWAVVFEDSTGLLNAAATEVALDADGNGKCELFVMGQSTNACWTTYIYETVGDNKYTIIDTLSVDCGIASGLTSNALGDLDGDGVPEYIMTAPSGLWVFGVSGVGAWSNIDLVNVFGLVLADDLNGNGKAELLSSENTTLVLESSVVSGVTDEPSIHPRLLLVFPNPSRGQPSVELGLSPGDHLSVYNIRGRLVERVSTKNSANPLRWGPSPLATGVYIFRVEDGLGAPIATRRVTIIR